MKFRIHLLALPNTQTTKEYSLDGFSQATIRFAKLLKLLGHEVILYASEENEAPCNELVTCITKEEVQTMLANTVNLATGQIEPTPYQYAYIESWSPIWQLANARMIQEISKRKQPGDLICSIGGASQKPVSDAHPDLAFVEWSIGYQGSFSPYRVFESYAWMHYTYGLQKIENARYYDTVIPLPFDPSDFPFKQEKENFALYVGRLIERKGLIIACQAAEAAGIPLKVIGHGDRKHVTHGAEYLGALSAQERNEWMSRAQCVLTPTIYIEPFNQVAIESMFCGTPVVATDLGGFTETIIPGVNGFRCSLLRDFVKAIKDSKNLSPDWIRNHACQTYSIEAIAPLYQAYFERVATLRLKDGKPGPGWYAV